MNTRIRILLFSSLLIAILGILFLSIKLFTQKKQPSIIAASIDSTAVDGYVGSRDCRECHERFYNLWSPSHHGKAMQPASDVLENEDLVLPESPLKVGNNWFEVIFKGPELIMIEKDSQNVLKEVNRYKARWALGGRNIYYFLTPFSGGRLQTMPLAYDINRREWYSNPTSAVRHFVDLNSSDEEVDWKHSLYTFNTTCHSCHVSQLQKNYEVSTNTYHTTWKEPGINCETCHGLSEEHIRVCREAEAKDEVPEDLKIISVKNFSTQQHNSACASCHAKGIPLTQNYIPGESFFQHFDLITLESPDYYPDGRDLGENYTMTTWLQSKCTVDNDLNCVTCHTSSGRYRYKNKDNDICASCHQDKLENFEAHSHHKLTDSISCVSCHMPKTEFARMTRSDHSMRPPTPAATIEFGSPNACNICHTEEDAEWANEYVTEWHGDYQDETMNIASLIYEGRNGNLNQINKILAKINDKNLDIIFRNSIIRILRNYQIRDYENYFLKALQDESPLIRSSAAELLGLFNNESSKNALLEALNDSILLVRNKASGSLVHFPRELFSQTEWERVEKSFKEYENFILAYPDTWSAHYNMGNYLQGRNKYQEAVRSYEKAIELEEEAVMPMVNASIAYNILGRNVEAESKLIRALELEPDNPILHLNYGLLLTEMQHLEQAESHLILALAIDSTLDNAAYNLAVLSARSNLKEAIKYISLAYKTAPENPRNGYTYAYYTYQEGDLKKAIELLGSVIKTAPDYIDAYLFLANIYEETNKIEAAISIYEQAANLENIPSGYRQNIRSRINQLKQ